MRFKMANGCSFKRDYSSWGIPMCSPKDEIISVFTIIANNLTCCCRVLSHVNVSVRHTPYRPTSTCSCTGWHTTTNFSENVLKGNIIQREIWFHRLSPYSEWFLYHWEHDRATLKWRTRIMLNFLGEWDENQKKMISKHFSIFWQETLLEQLVHLNKRDAMYKSYTASSIGWVFGTPWWWMVENGGLSASGHHLGWPHFPFPPYWMRSLPREVTSQETENEVIPDGDRKRKGPPSVLDDVCRTLRLLKNVLQTSASPMTHHDLVAHVFQRYSEIRSDDVWFILLGILEASDR